MSGVNKPAYRVPSMKEINIIPWNGFNVVSTFSGCGGSSLGYRMAGFKVLWASEFIDAARDSYNANKAPYTIVDPRDIRQVKAEDILDATGLKKGEIDLFDGSPPCASFSSAGKREKAWGQVKKYSDKTQRVDDLFFEYSRLLEKLQPKVFVAENVKGLIKGSAKGYFKIILSKLKKCGYRVKVKVLDSAWLGVPQSRERTIFIGVRNDLNVEPAFPRPFNYAFAVREVLPYVIEIKKSGSPYNYVQANVPSPTVMQSDAKRPESSYFSGGGWLKTKTETRKFTIAELKIISGFPSDFILKGTFANQWERIGRAVPPVMMYNIAKNIHEKILRPKNS